MTHHMFMGAPLSEHDLFDGHKPRVHFAPLDDHSNHAHSITACSVASKIDNRLLNLKFGPPAQGQDRHLISPSPTHHCVACGCCRLEAAWHTHHGKNKSLWGSVDAWALLVLAGGGSEKLWKKECWQAEDLEPDRATH